MEDKTQALLEGQFFLYPLRLTNYQVKLTRQGITFYELPKRKDKLKPERNIHIGDVVGCRCKRAKLVTDTSAYFTIFSYQFKAKSKRKRHRKEFTFGLHESSVFDENLNICQKWRNVILCLSRNISVNSHELDLCVLPTRRRLLVLVNPNSGPGKAVQIFENSVKSMLEEADIIFQVLITEYAGHATEVIKTLKLDEWTGVVIVSGDGLIYEVINGLMNRKDWDRAIQFPIGCIPGGSGNALCCSVNYLAGEPLDADMVLHSTFVLLKHRILPIDLVMLQTPTGQVYSFLSVAWGILADIDYESEKLRAIGSTRFTLYAIMRLLKLRTYRAKISFLPITDCQMKEKGKKSNSVPFSKPRRYTIFSNNSNQEVLSSVCDTGCRGKFKSKNGDDSQRMRSQSMPSNMSEYLSKSVTPSESMDKVVESNESLIDVEEEEKIRKMDDSGNHSSGSNVENGLVDLNVNSQMNGMYDNDSCDETISVIKDSAEPVPCPLLSPLDKPVPSNWETIEGDFISALAIYLPYLGPDNLASPDSRLNDGCINLLLIKGGVSKKDLISMFLKFSTGEHINSPHCNLVKCLAFRLEPQTEKGNIMVDGERIKYGPIQGQILPGLARIMAMQ